MPSKPRDVVPPDEDGPTEDQLAALNEDDGTPQDVRYLFVGVRGIILEFDEDGLDEYLAGAVLQDGDAVYTYVEQRMAKDVLRGITP